MDKDGLLTPNALILLSDCSNRTLPQGLDRLGISSEPQLLLARHGDFHLNLPNYNSENINESEFFICLTHRDNYGRYWKRSSNKCQVPESISGHRITNRPTALRHLSLENSEIIFYATKEFVPVGSGNSGLQIELLCT